jgi:hypothetical protein
MSLPHLMLHLSDAEVGKRCGRGNWYGRREKNKNNILSTPIKGRGARYPSPTKLQQEEGEKDKINLLLLYKVI